jgi:transposase-like protein
MKKKVSLNPKKVYSESFRKARVSEYESGRYTVAEICRLYGISDGSVYQWIYRYSTYNKKGYKVVEEKNSGQSRVKEMEQKIADLERALGQKQVRVDYLENLIELANEKYSTDLKKNSNTPQSRK